MLQKQSFLFVIFVSMVFVCVNNNSYATKSNSARSDDPITEARLTACIQAINTSMMSKMKDRSEKALCVAYALYYANGGYSSDSKKSDVRGKYDACLIARKVTSYEQWEHTEAESQVFEDYLDSHEALMKQIDDYVKGVSKEKPELFVDHGQEGGLAFNSVKRGAKGHAAELQRIRDAGVKKAWQDLNDRFLQLDAQQICADYAMFYGENRQKSEQEQVQIYLDALKKNGLFYPQEESEAVKRNEFIAYARNWVGNMKSIDHSIRQ